jgi:hypothetical protein
MGNKAQGNLRRQVNIDSFSATPRSPHGYSNSNHRDREQECQRLRINQLADGRPDRSSDNA